MRTVLLLFLATFNSASFAALNPALSFYRSQQSLFSSGQASRGDLENKVLRRELEPWFRVTWNKKEYEVPGEIMVKDLQTTQTLTAKEAIDILKSPQSGSPRAFQLPAQANVIVLKTDAYWAEVLEPKSKNKGWAPLHVFTAPNEDKGVYITLIDSFLQKSAQSSGEIITTIPRNVRLMPLEIEKNFLKVQYNTHIGYVDLSNLACRGDFAMWAYHKRQGWLGISHRENGFLMTVNNQKIPLNDFIAFSPYSNRGVISQKLSEDGPSIRSRVQILDQKAHRWALSVLEGHGEVWWRTEDTEQLTKSESTQQISTEQLLKKEISAFSFASTKSMKGLASANGIYRTEDGKTWTQIPLFEDKNYPVTIHPDGIWYVGSYRSFDEGKTFEPYIKWDKLAEQIQAGIHKAPRHLRIAQIEALPHSRIRILVDTGVQKIKMQAHILSHEWTLVK